MTGGFARRSKKAKIRWLVSASVLACVIVLIVWRKQVLTGVGQSLVVSDPLEKADLIYVLAGDFFGSRVLLGAELGARGYAPRVLLSGGRYQNSYSGDLAVQFAIEHGYQPTLFSAVRMDAPSTMEEARSMGPV